MNEFKVGEMVEVSDTQIAWFPCKFIGMCNGWFLVKHNETDRPIAWTHCRSSQSNRRVPTDKDAIEAMATKGERLPCWVKNHRDFDWQEAILFKVWSGGNYRFVASIKDGQCDSYRLCEVEVKA